MDIVEIIEVAKSYPDIFIDCGIRQERTTVLQQLDKRSNGRASEFIDAFIEDIQKRIANLTNRTKPYQIPHEYIFFLEYYGGLSINTDSYHFSTFGIGIMVEEEYGSIDSDDVFHEPGKYGVLKIGMLSFRTGKYKFQYVDFFLDLAGHVQKHCVIGVGPWGGNSIDSTTIAKDIHKHPDLWEKTSVTFTEWLKYVVRKKEDGGWG